MTKKVRITSLATAVVMFLTMSGANIKKVNDYNGEHIEFSIVQTAEAEASKYFLYSLVHAPAGNFTTMDRLSLPVNTMILNMMVMYECMPEIFDLALTPEEKQVLDECYALYINEKPEKAFKIIHEKGNAIYNKLVDYLCDYMMGLEPLSKELNAKNGEELYSQTKRLYLEANIYIATNKWFNENKQVGKLSGYLKDFNAIMAEMEDPNYDLEANYKADMKRLSKLYSNVYSTLNSCYKADGIKASYNKNGVKVTRSTGRVAATNESYDDPVDYEAYFPYAEILDPFTDYNPAYVDKDMANYSIIYAGVRFLNEGTLQIICDATGYDPNTGDSKYYWEVVNKNANGNYYLGDYNKVLKGYHEFTLYLEKYFRMCHLERPELVAENYTQMEDYAQGMEILCFLMMDMLGTYGNNPDRSIYINNAYTICNSLELYANLSNEDKYSQLYENTNNTYMELQKGLVRYCREFLDECFYDSDSMIPVMDFETTKTK